MLRLWELLEMLDGDGIIVVNLHDVSHRLEELGYPPDPQIVIDEPDTDIDSVSTD